MKKYYFLLVGLLLAPITVLASTFYAGENYSLERGATEPGNTYVVSGEAVISGDVNGDLVTAGGYVAVEGNVTGDFVGVGGTAKVLGNVLGDVRSAGGDIAVNGAVLGDFMAAGGRIQIFPGGSVGGDVALAGGDLILDGSVAGKVRMVGGRVELNHAIGGDVIVTAREVVVGPQAVITGDLHIRSKVAPKIDPSARISGQVDFKPMKKSGDVRIISKILIVFLGLALFMKFMMVLATALATVWLARKTASTLAHEVLGDFRRSLLTGLLVAVLMPISAIALITTIIGIPFGALVMLGYFVLLILSHVLGALVVGSWLIGLYEKKTRAMLDWRAAVLGVVVVCVVKLIPFVGWLFVCVFVLASMGSIARAFHRHLWMNR